MGVRDQLRGFPFGQMAIISVVRLSEPIAFTSLFPYVYFMLIRFGIAEEETWRYSSYYASSFALCQVIFAVHWGRAADKIGRKNTIMLSTFGTSLSMLMFGFSTNFWMGLFARCMMGSFTTIPVVRTLIGEVCTERRHQTYGFSVISVFWSLGSIIGPAIGGSKYLTKHVADPTSFSGKYPYALNNFVIAAYIWVAIVFAYFFLVETHPTKKYQRDRGVDLGDAFLRKLGYEVPTRPWNEPKAVAETAPLVVLRLDIYSAVDTDSDDDLVHSGLLSRRTSMAIIQRYSSRNSDVESIFTLRNGVSQGAFTKPVVLTVVANFILSFHNIVFLEFVPVFLAGDFKLDELKFPLHIRGGFGMDSSAIGHLLSSTGSIAILGMFLLFPHMDKHFLPSTSFRLGLLIYPVIYFALPFLIFTLPAYNSAFPEGFTKVALYMTSSLSSIAGTLCFPLILTMIHRACPAEHRAFINGASLSITSLARAIAPLAWGNVMSLAEKYGYTGLSWWGLGILAIGGCFQSLLLKDYDEDLKD